jgi:hypothetical protein
MVTTPDTEFEPWPPEVEPEAAAIREARGVFVHGRSPNTQSRRATSADQLFSRAKPRGW